MNVTEDGGQSGSVASGSTPDHDAVLCVDRVSKAYAAVQALDHVSFTVHSGEIVALVGDNGAGKSTLVKTMAGVIIPDTGRIFSKGQELQLNTPGDAVEAGVATVFQDLALCNNLDVVANLFLTREESRYSILNELGMESASRGLLAQLAIKPPSLRAPISTMSGGQRQSVAIARCLLGDPKVIILDEPTAALGLPQKKQVLDLTLRLKARGLGVVLISHNMAEVLQVADRVEVLYQGANAASYPGRKEFEQQIVAAITGSNINTTVG